MSIGLSASDGVRLPVFVRPVWKKNFCLYCKFVYLPRLQKIQVKVSSSIIHCFKISTPILLRCAETKLQRIIKGLYRKLRLKLKFCIFWCLRMFSINLVYIPNYILRHRSNFVASWSVKLYMQVFRLAICCTVKSISKSIVISIGISIGGFFRNYR